MSGEMIALVVVAVIAVVAALLLSYLTAHRLDRLHIRTDLARQALAGALARRHTVAASVARHLADTDPAGADRLTRALDAARAHPPGAVAGVDPAPEPVPERRRRGRRGEETRGVDDDHAPEVEVAENRLGAVLAGLDRSALPDDLAAELDDASDRVSIARRFYNDAVRDTRALREHALVRALRLAGRAPMPDFVELVDPEPQGA